MNKRVTDVDEGVTSRRQMLGRAGVATLAAAGGAVMLADHASAQDLQVVFIPFGPQRVYDTRDGEGRLSANQERNLVGAAAPNELAHLYNVTITETQGAGGYLSVFPGDISWPGSSSINWFGPNQMLANNAFTWLADDDQSINLRAGGPGGSGTHIVLDLVGILVILDLGLTALDARQLGIGDRGAPRLMRRSGADQPVE